ncbi:MAG: hypothetical protein HQK54_16850, partial [Oligoflexales bacterium]|nr:hypothetical protein [Oligoflexales bacterium]
RSGASLAILIVSDEDNCSAKEQITDGVCLGQPYLETSYLTNVLSNDLGRKLKETARVYGIFIPSKEESLKCPLVPSVSGSATWRGNVAYRHLEIVAATGGAYGSICDEDYGATLEKISLDLKNLIQTKFTLKYPAIASMTKVFVNDAPQSTGWSISGNTLVFSTAPEPSAKIRIEYTYVAAETTDFTTQKAIQNPDEMTVSLDDRALTPSDYRLSDAKNSIIFKSTPIGKELKVSYKNANINEFPVTIPKELQGTTKVTEKESGKAIGFELKDDKIILNKNDLNVGKTILVQYDNKYRDPAAVPVAEKLYGKGVIIAKSKDKTCVSPDTIKAAENSIDITQCGFAEGDVINIEYEYIVNITNKFTFDDEKIKNQSDITWTVKVNGIDTSDFTREENTFTVNGLKPEDTVLVQAKFFP